MTSSDQPPPADRRRPRPDGIEVPYPSRFNPSRPHYEEAMAAHREAVADGRPGYLDPATGLFAMTAAHLLERGWCCDRGCRHCPWVGGPTEGDPS